MEVLKSLSIDLSEKQNQPVVYAVQGDKNARKIKFILFQNGLSLSVDTVDQVLISYQKPDGHGGVYDTLEDGTLAYEFDSYAHNSVTITMAKQVLTTPGNVLLIASFISGNSVMSTFNVIVNVEENPGIGVSESVDYFSLSVAIDVAKKLVGETFDPNNFVSQKYVDEQVDSLSEDIKSVSEGSKTFYVNISKNSYGTFIADKSVPVIDSAYKSGRNVKAKIEIDGEVVSIPLIGIIEDDTAYYVGYAIYGKYVSISHTGENVFVNVNDIQSETSKNAILYTPQELTPEQQAQALTNLGLDELPTGGSSNVFSITEETTEALTSFTIQLPTTFDNIYILNVHITFGTIEQTFKLHFHYGNGDWKSHDITAEMEAGSGDAVGLNLFSVRYGDKARFALNGISNSYYYAALPSLSGNMSGRTKAGGTKNNLWFGTNSDSLFIPAGTKFNVWGLRK